MIIFYPAQFWAHKNHIYILKALNILQNEGSDSLGAIFQVQIREIYLI